MAVAHSIKDEDFAEEIDDHIRREAKRLVDDEGLTFVDARAKALRSFGKYHDYESDSTNRGA